MSKEPAGSTAVQAAVSEPVSTAGCPAENQGELSSSDKRRLRSSVLKAKQTAGPAGSLAPGSHLHVEQETHTRHFTAEAALVTVSICHLCPEVSHLPGGRLMSCSSSMDGRRGPLD